MRILIVEDSLVLLSALKNELENRGHMVEIGMNGLEAYRKAFEFLPNVILSDVIMPSMNGYHLCRLLKNSEMFKKVPVILLTALEQPLDKFWGYQSGADFFLTKGSSLGEMIDRVEAIAEENSYHFPATAGNTTLKEKMAFTELADLFDEVLLKSTIENHMLALMEHLDDMGYIMKELVGFLESITELEAVRILLGSVGTGNIFFKSGKYNSGSLEEHIDEYFKALNRPLIPVQWKKYVINEGEERLNRKALKRYDAPVIVNGSEKGLFTFYYNENREISERENLVLKEFMKNFNRIVGTMSLFNTYKNDSFKDGLTDLYNYRYLMEEMGKESNFALIMIDIDNFKEINDNFGHLTGNDVLVEISGIIKDSIRKNDIAARFGGEEFVVLLPGAVEETGPSIAERIRSRVENNDWGKFSDRLKVSVSCGVSCNKSGKLTSTESIEQADKKLYKAKQSGKNVVVY